ncbi:DUF6578 domain-containing protein [Frigoribacterium sp. CFBP 13707]|uniref:DUF6578 domain-containing protein n=1 Tax=Frigoribacterium sp. CFBP 13707 TaxID=2775313 RepID=UPI00178255FE|nr:DUF6578 domain-containing protein [Frigoribacterium sp. CFBP 13707]MBD8726325.1 hypothetical protein [Frigoribacterium sp. CFBP 13707]
MATSVTVWVDAWQLVQGHDVFRVADVVSWPVTVPAPGADRLAGLHAPADPDLLVEHYGATHRVSTVTGTVAAIGRASAPVAWNVTSVLGTADWDDRGVPRGSAATS